MSTTVTKRQQARNERALQDIVKTVPGNGRCADCNAPNPSWASWNIGVFLCMRCAGLHRKLGTHVSKVKSLSMDSWSTEQVDNMRKMGNANSNRQLNPRNVAAQIPIDVDEVDAAIEKHIRQKYEQEAFTTGTRSAPTSRHNSGNLAAGSDEPPPLPPKPGRHWYSIRSASSTLPKSKYDLPDAPISAAIKVEERATKSGRSGFFGSRVTSVGNNFDQKLNMLKEMGFADTKQNSEILKSVDGSLDRAVEILSRLNEDHSSRVPAPVPTSLSSGLRLSKIRDNNAAAREVKEPKRSATAPLPPLPERSQSSEPVGNTWNPFLQPQQAVTTAMQNMSLQPTGSAQSPGVYNSHQPLSVQTTGNPWGLYMQPQQAMSVPAIPMQAFGQPSPVSTTNPFYQTASPQSFTSSNPWSQQMTPQTTTPSTPYSNPFGIPWAEQATASKLQNTQVQHVASLNPFPTPPAQAFQGNNPFGVPPAQQQAAMIHPPNNIQQQQTASYSAQIMPHTQASYAAQQQQQQQPSVFNSQPQAQPFSAASPVLQTQTSPFPTTSQGSFPQTHSFAGSAQSIQQQAQPVVAAQQPMPAYPQQQSAFTGYQQQASVRHDKSSIMALYNYPQAVPHTQLQTLPEDSVSVPIPHPQGNNPFAFQQPSQITSHVSKESVDFQAFSQNGRQSPDAFAGLSSRYMR